MPDVKVYLYWPFCREEERDLPVAISGHVELTVHVLDRPGRLMAAPSFRLLSDLPEVDEVTRGARWAVSRVQTYGGRMLARRRALKADRYDLVHVHYLNRYTDCVDLALLGRTKPLVVTVHDPWPHASWSPAVDERLLAFSLRGAAAVIVHHDRLVDYLVSEIGVPANLIHVVPHPVFPPIDRPDAEWNGGADRPVEVLFFGTFRSNKGIEVLLEAAARIPPDVSFRLHLAGRGEPRLERMVERVAASSSRVSCEIGHASASAKAAMYRRADLVALPYTQFDSQSGVLHDAYSYSLPVVVTDIGTLGSTVRDDETGWIAAPGDAESLASRITAAIESPERRREFAAMATRRAAERHPDVVAEAFADIYRRCLTLRGSAIA